MMTVAILSDAPTLTTGFGVTTKHIADALRLSGYDVACFGLKARPDDVAGRAAYRIWPGEQGGHWTAALPGFFAATKPRVLVLNMDAYNAVECVEAVRAAGFAGPLISYVVFDGLPVGRHYLDAQRGCDAVVASSHTAAGYLRANGVEVVGVAPPGVDTTIFKPDPGHFSLLGRAGAVHEKVIGVFGTNTERKQIARVVAALPAIKAQIAPADVLLYIHCRPIGFWRLTDLAADLGMADCVMFPGPASFDDRRGVPAAGDSHAAARLSAGPVTLPADLPYVDRLNLCDVVVNAPHSGDIEQVILEAQACGVPLVHTDDQGVMAEAVGAGGFLLPAKEVGIGRAGERIRYVAVDDIAAAVLTVLTDEQTSAKLRAAGLANAARYPWTLLETEICKAVRLVAGDRDEPAKGAPS